jgi:DNA polymerase-3 subunit epsilon
MSIMKKLNLAFIDTEATGLDFERHELTEIGCILVEQNWESEDKKPVFKVIEEFEIKIRPEHIETADPVALRVNGYDPENWKEAFSTEEAMKLFGAKTSGAIMVAHNVSADYIFLEKAFHDSRVENEMHYHKLDTVSIAFAKLHLTEDADKYSLQFLCDYFGIKNEHAHRALPDARATFELYKKLMNL